MSNQDDVSKSPSWFRRATEMEITHRNLEHNGTDLHYMTWGSPADPPLVFVHGGAAHGHWWSFLAPLFTPTYFVIVVDLSGHGDSGRKDEYPVSEWADELVAVIHDAGCCQLPVIVGHSMGGFVSIATAALHPNELSGVVILDSPVVRQDPEVEAARLTSVFRAPKVYTNREEMVARFRTVPEQKNYEPYVFDFVARHSIGDVEGGYSWKFDPRIFSPWRNTIDDHLSEVTCRVALFRAEHGLVTEDIGQYMYDQLGRTAPVVEIPSAGHHMMLDQPLLLLTALRVILADWNHSVPHVRVV